MSSKSSKLIHHQTHQSIHQNEREDHQVEPEEEEEDSLKDLDLDDIDSLRTQSIKTFQSNLQTIYSKYEGDGDEEADDVVDLVKLEVIEDRGKIIKTLGTRQDHLRYQTQTWTKPSSKKSTSRIQSNQPLTDLIIPSDTTCSDEEADWIDDEIGSVSSSSDSIIFLTQPTSSNHRLPTRSLASSPLTLSKISLRSELPKLSSPSKLSTLQSFQHIHGTATNALFERLKQRVQEKSIDLRQLRNQNKPRETSQESEASSQLYTKISTYTASDIVTESSSEPWKDSKPSSTYRTDPSGSSSRHSLCSSSITPRYSNPHPNSLQHSLSPISASKVSSNKRPRPVFESNCLPTPSTIICPRQPRPGPSRLKHELNLRTNPKDSHRPKPIPSRLKAVNPSQSNPSKPSTSRPVKSLPRPHRRSTTWIDPKPIPLNRSSRESSEDPLGLPPTPSRRRSEARSKPNGFQLHQIPKPKLKPNHFLLHQIPKPKPKLEMSYKSKETSKKNEGEMMG
ncbi:uncharacterized protein MELLADRAFT_77344 [Melampsora larici-populina 98AG31]|uniref:Uncharacterized protein n=1 Tax=Melampsora larici-populina (strain 98AG31 / pathotype 3-4-7) TaxID=747676 RepID=F4RGM7_MELLP|nr:uncharacterized protein MELLADRAFT_77344 [Melampsora larici-populina 98AG31]EGG08620.1 hypothetical protein MELLADRAFT_77344 [Melampsora larici-populina 98AG31]